MSRKRRGKTAGSDVRGRAPKGKPTPKNTPGTMTRVQIDRILARRAEHAIKKGDGVERMRQTIRDGVMSERDALEMLLREAGRLILEPKEQ